MNSRRAGRTPVVHDIEETCYSGTVQLEKVHRGSYMLICMCKNKGSSLGGEGSGLPGQSG